MKPSQLKNDIPAWDWREAHRWPVIVGIIVAGALIIPLIWIVCRQCCFRKKPAKLMNPPIISHPSSSPYKQEMQPPPYNSPETAQVDGIVLTKLGDDSLPPMPLHKTASQKELPARPQEEEIEMGHLNSTSALAPAPIPSPNPPVPIYHPVRPMSRLTPLNTRNLHNSLLVYPPSRPMQHQHDRYAQDRSGDATPTDSAPPQYYSPFTPPEKPYAHLSMQFPYATSPVRREASPFVEQPASALGTYRAYSPALGPQRPSNATQTEPIELASPFNQRPESIPAVPGAFPSPSHDSERTISPPPQFETRQQQAARTLSPPPQFESRQQPRRNLSPSPQFGNKQQQKPIDALQQAPTQPGRIMWHACVSSWASRRVVWGGGGFFSFGPVKI